MELLVFHMNFTYGQTCFYSKTNQMHNISNLFYFGTTLYMKISLLKSNWCTLCNYINIKMD